MILIEDEFIRQWRTRKPNISLSDINNYRILYNIVLNKLLELTNGK